jgi:glutamine amidotransferase
MKSVGIVDYGMGNVASIANMIRKAGGEAFVAASPEALAAADRWVLPGVGAFDKGVEALKARGLDAWVRARAAQGGLVLGICLGLQLLTERSEEGRLPGLGLVPGETRRFRSDDPGLKIPNMGWGVVTPARGTPLFDFPSPEEKRFYFTHSYHVVCAAPSDVAATAAHGGPFTAAVVRGNVWGVQFHPEKSHRFGLELFRRFLAAPSC